MRIGVIGWVALASVLNACSSEVPGGGHVDGASNPPFDSGLAFGADAGDRLDSGMAFDAADGNDAGTTRDAGATHDGGDSNDDAGATSDAGEPLDAGAAADAGPPDSGGAPDAGMPDAGGPPPVTCMEPGLVTQTIVDSASVGTPDTYFFDVNPGDPFCAEIVGGGGSWGVTVSNGTSGGIYCSNITPCRIRVPVGQPTLLVTAQTNNIGAYTLTVRSIPR